MEQQASTSLSLKDYRDIAIEAGMQLIPYVGGSLAAIYFGRKQEIRFKRLESLYKEVAEEVQCIQSEIADLSNQNPDELRAIIEVMNEKIESESVELKRQYYKRFFVNTLKNPVNGNYEERKLFLDIISQSTLLQLEIVAFLASQSSPVTSHSLKKPGVEQAVLLGSVAQMKNYGIINGVLNEILFGKDSNLIDEKINLTDFGKQFHDFCISHT